MKLPIILSSILATGLVFAAPSNAFGKHKDSKCYSGHHHHGSRTVYVSHGHYGHGYRPYYPYYPRYYSAPSLSFGFYSTPAYYRTATYYDSYPSYPVRTVYRGVAASRPSYSDDLAVDVQRSLARRGFYRGEIDGEVGPGTRAAIRSYQYNRGLTVTGRIDSTLLRSLGLS